MELAPAPVTCSEGDCVSHFALRGPPPEEHAVPAGAAAAFGVGFVPWAAVVVVTPAGGAAVVVVGGVLVLVVVVVCDFSLAAVGLEDPHAPSTRARPATAAVASHAGRRAPRRWPSAPRDCARST